MEAKTPQRGTKLTLEIITPEGFSFKEQVDDVVAPGTEGQFGVLPGHINFLTALDPGIITYKKDNETKQIKVATAYTRVLNDHVLIIADSVEILS